MAKDKWPRPWSVEDLGDKTWAIIDANGRYVPRLEHLDSEPLARLIVKAVNAHDDLLAACERANGLLEHLMKTVDWGKTFDLDIAGLNACLCDLPRAIALAKGEATT